VVISIFALQVLGVLPALVYDVSAQASTGPNLTSITLTSYNGNDQSGVADLAAGKIAAYDFALTPAELSELNSSFSRISTPSSLYDLMLNPVNTTFGFNPFQFTAVRQAVNYVVDRNYFVDNLLGGYGIPALSALAGEPDSLVIANTTAMYAGYSQYNLALANQSIYATLTANGATYATPSSGGNKTWSYDGTPITIYIIQRTDDPTRDTYAGFLASQFEDLGFTVNLVPANLDKAISLVYSSDPHNSTWDIYPEGWGAAYLYYDEGLPASLNSPIGGLSPFSDSTSLSLGTYNDTAYEQSDLVQNANLADQVGLALITGNFTSFAQRSALLNNDTNLGFQLAVRIYLATSLSAYAANPSQLSNITPQFVEDPILNTLSYVTMNSPTGTANIGVRFIAQGALNPIGGWNDEYSIGVSAGTVLPLVYYQPATAYDYAIGFNYKLDSISPTANVTVPSSALEYNYTTGNFVNVPNGTMAKVAVDVNYAPLIDSEKWSDGQAISLADIMYQYVIYENASLSSNSSIYDGYANSDYAPDLQTILGFQIINSTSMTVYSSYYYPDYNFAALSDATLAPVLGNRLPGGDMMPWQLYQAMANVVAEGKAAWSTSAATAKSIDWLNLVSPTDVASISTQLTTMASQSFIPRQLTQLQNLTGVNMTTPSQAAAGYSALSSFISKYGNAVVSDGPYVISQWQTSTTPNYAILTKNPYFTASIITSALFAPATTITTTGTIPSVLSAGSSFNVTALSTLIGTNQTTPQSGVNLVVQIVGNTSVVSQTSTISGSNGQATITIPSTVPSGTYTLIVYGSSSASTLINPFETSITLVSPTTTSSSSSTTSSSSVTTSVQSVTNTTSSSSSITTSTPPPTSTSSSVSPSSSISTTTTSSSTTSSSNNSAILEAAAVVVVIIIVVAAVIALRRRGGSSTTSPPPST